MSLNLVTVTISATVSPIDVTAAEGNYVFVPSGTQWPAPGDVPIVPAVVHGMLTVGTGSATAQLVASDNFATGVLTWNVLVNIRGLPTVNVRDVPVLYASGASQNLWDILTAMGWIPIGT